MPRFTFDQDKFLNEDPAPASTLITKKGLLVTPIPSSGVKPFVVYGEVTIKYFPESMGGTIYYCGDRSFPANIVTVLNDDKG